MKVQGDDFNCFFSVETLHVHARVRGLMETAAPDVKGLGSLGQTKRKIGH